jgi:choice-of-anchor A domain-containing protein
VPTTKAATTAVPTTAVPTTKVPTTAVPTTAVPTTRVPTTAVPTTQVPTTAVPTTRVPTTAVPTTAVPTTQVPTTQVPTTAVPTTQVPTTAVPTTQVPTTAVPTTAVPTTAVATTGIPLPPPPPPFPYGTCDQPNQFFGYLPSFFNTFVYENYTCYNSDTEGRLAAGGSIDLYNYGVACRLFAPASQQSCSYNVTCDEIAAQGQIIDSVVAGDNVYIIQGSVYVGNIATGGTYNNDITVNWGPGCTLFQGEVIDFDSAFDFLQNLAATVASQNSTGTIENNYNSLIFQGTNNPSIEVFDIAGSLLCNSYGVTLDLSTVAPTASVFVNVAGDNLSCGNFQMSNFNSSQTLWNFYEETSLALQNIEWTGSVLAPWANVVAQNGAIDGQVFVNSWYAPPTVTCMQQNWVPFYGCLPSAGHIPSDNY